MIMDHIGYSTGSRGLCSAGPATDLAKEQEKSDTNKPALNTVRERLYSMNKETNQNNVERQLWDAQREIGIVVETLCAEIDKLNNRIDVIQSNIKETK